MNTSKIVSLIIAALAAVLVAAAGKSCADDINQKNIERRKKETTEAHSYHLITETTLPATYEDTDENTEDQPQLIEDPSATEEREYETVTNLFGEVVETIPVTTPEEANMPTTTLSALDAYNALHTTEPTTATQYATVDPENITFELNW